MSPVTLYSADGAPYDDELPLNFYRAPGVRVVPLSALEGGAPKVEAPGGRPFVLYQGLRPPVPLAARLAGCRPVTRALPPWLLASDRLGWLSGGTVWTLCRPDAPARASARPAP